jgi:hypothetical protein
MEVASTAVYLRESEDIVLDAEGILGSDCDPQKSGQGPKAPHVEVCKVDEPVVLVDDDAQSVEKDKHTLPAATWSLRIRYTFADLRHPHQSCDIRT